MNQLYEQPVVRAQGDKILISNGKVQKDYQLFEGVVSKDAQVVTRDDSELEKMLQHAKLNDSLKNTEQLEQKKQHEDAYQTDIQAL